MKTFHKKEPTAIERDITFTEALIAFIKSWSKMRNAVPESKAALVAAEKQLQIYKAEGTLANSVQEIQEKQSKRKMS